MHYRHFYFLTRGTIYFTYIEINSHGKNMISHIRIVINKIIISCRLVFCAALKGQICAEESLADIAVNTIIMCNETWKTSK